MTQVPGYSRHVKMRGAIDFDEICPGSLNFTDVQEKSTNATCLKKHQLTKEYISVLTGGNDDRVKISKEVVWLSLLAKVKHY